jgi:CRISPR-associated endoribonuclease Cas6
MCAWIVLVIESMAQHTQSVSQLRRISLTVRPQSRFPVPTSDGYSVYSALLTVFDEIDADVSAHVHDSPLGSLHSSGLCGVFGQSERAHHKTVRPDEEYQLTLGIVDPADVEIFQTLVSALVLEGETLALTNGTLRVETFESENTTHTALLDRAAGLDAPTIAMDFRTPTCIEEAGDVTTLMPHRWTVFNSLLGKWNRSCPDDVALDLSREAVLRHVIEKPDFSTLDSHSVLVNRVRNDEDENRNIFRQGFTGECSYAFKDASTSVANAVTALALFGGYSGVGSAVSRGCGAINVGVRE